MKNTFNVTNYGPGKTIFKDETHEYPKETILRSAFLAKLKATEEGLTKSDFSSKGAPLIKRYS